MLSLSWFSLYIFNAFASYMRRALRRYTLLSCFDDFVSRCYQLFLIVVVVIVYHSQTLSSPIKFISSILSFFFSISMARGKVECKAKEEKKTKINRKNAIHDMNRSTKKIHSVSVSSNNTCVYLRPQMCVDLWYYRHWLQFATSRSLPMYSRLFCFCVAFLARSLCLVLYKPAKSPRSGILNISMDGIKKYKTEIRRW